MRMTSGPLAPCRAWQTGAAPRAGVKGAGAPGREAAAGPAIPSAERPFWACSCCTARVVLAPYRPRLHSSHRWTEASAARERARPSPSRRVEKLSSTPVEARTALAVQLGCVFAPACRPPSGCSPVERPHRHRDRVAVNAVDRAVIPQIVGAPAGGTSSPMLPVCSVPPPIGRGEEEGTVAR